MYVHRGTVQETAERATQAAFFDVCARRFEELHGSAVRRQEHESWRHSWPALLEILTRAGLGSLEIALEFTLPATGERVDALVMGQDSRGVLTAVAIELKQWTHARRSRVSGMVEVGNRTLAHPARQVGGYVSYLRNWVGDGPTLRSKGVAVLHNASEELMGILREMVPPSAPSAEFPMLGRSDLMDGMGSAELAAGLGCDGLTTPTEDAIAALLATEHRPSRQALEQFAKNIEGNDSFVLVGEQDRARLAILDAVAKVREKGPGRLIVVAGGPGTGKTAVAARVMGELCRRPGLNPRLLTTSGALTKQLKRLLGDSSHGLVNTFKGGTLRGLDRNSVVLIDEAHRVPARPQHSTGFPGALDRLIQQVGVLVLFLDERQIVRPWEGVTLPQIRHYAEATGVQPEYVDLTTQFRCNGSQAYFQWVDQVFAPTGSASAWAGHDYDLALSADPEEAENWVAAHTRDGRTARITAGYCWPWTAPKGSTLADDIAIPWVDGRGREQVWRHPWNLGSEEALPMLPGVPGRPYWATDPGGHRQVGCIYTAQGLEYDYGVVIVGDDLVRRDGRWLARPAASHERQMRELSPEHYLRLALNIYRVLATRGTLGVRFWSTDEETRNHLAKLLPPA
ncbi:DNA/RNA helicase domain-containing protein [Kitasatospora cineracea]|uniref:DNA/RNA helicase domain-containing protein n=1 Tax=Kitasatospora cineracea TaxID=88074 RepID=UPI0033E796AF